MAARRSIPPGGGYLNLSPDNVEPIATPSPVASNRVCDAEIPREVMKGQVDMAPNEVENNGMHQQEYEESDAVMESIDEKIAKVKRVLQELVEERQDDIEDTPANDLVALADPHPMSKPSHGRPKKQHRSVASVSHSLSSGTIQDAVKSNIKENEKSRSSDAKAPVNDEVTIERTRPVLQDESAIERSNNDDSLEQHRRFCMMQADKEGKSAEVRADEEPNVEATGSEKAKFSKRTVFSVPRKFCEIPPSQVPTRFTNPTPHMAPPPRFRLSAPGAQTGIALASPSTAVFSSSRGFSMESWFKRKLTRDFLNGGA